MKAEILNQELIKTNDPRLDENQEKVIEYLKAMNLIENLSKDEVKRFIEISQAFNLNPFKREVYAIKFRDKFNIVVGYETYIKRAERTKLCSGWHVTTEGKISDKSLKAVITIHRKDWDHAFVHEVYFVEYVRQSMIWKEKPVTMIKKVAMAQGFRLCFNDELGGMPYTTEELDVHQEPQQQKKVVKKVAPVKTEGNVKGILKTNDECIPDDMADKINACKTIKPEMVNLWNTYDDLHDCKEFKDLFSIKRKQLEVQKALENEFNTQEVQDVIDEETGVKNMTDELGVAGAKLIIKDQKTIDDVMVITEKENRKTVLSYAQKHMEKLGGQNGTIPPPPVVYSDTLFKTEDKNNDKS